MNATSSSPDACPAKPGAEGRIFSFDVFADPLTAVDAHEGHMRLHEVAPDIFWTPCNGGHWMVTRFADVSAVMRNPEVFSSAHIALSTSDEKLSFPLPPQDMDPPEHLPHRLLLRQFLSPKAVRALEPRIREIVAERLDALQERRECEFLTEFAMPLAARVFLSMMQCEDAPSRELAGCVDQLLRGTDVGRIADAMERLSAFTSELIRERIAAPGDDPVSILLRSQIDGWPLSQERVHGMTNLLLVAGLDTLHTSATFFMNHFARDPELQQRLRQEPDRIPRAVEELLRRFTFLNLPRRIMRDFELRGVQLRAGETIVCSLAAGSNDDRVFDHPERVDLGRAPAPHLAFNVGPHMCAGATLARTELRILLEEWFRRMPDVRHAPGFVPRPRGGTVMAIEELRLVW